MPTTLHKVADAPYVAPALGGRGGFMTGDERFKGRLMDRDKCLAGGEGHVVTLLRKGR